MTSSTLIVGAGISGLTLAHSLKRAGEQVTVLERSDYPGGKLRSWWEKGYLLEAGPNGFLDRDGDTRELARELGIEDRIRPAAPVSRQRYVYSRGALRPLPLSPPAFLRSDLLPLGSRLRVALELFSRRSKEPDESLASFGARHLGERATRVLLDAMQLGTWAGDVDRLSVRAAFPRFHSLEAEHRSLVLGMIRTAKKKQQVAPGALAPSGQLANFDQGMQTLTDALAGELGASLRTGAQVSGVQRDADGWRATLSTGEELRAKRLVLATPPPDSARMLEPLGDGTLQETLGAIRTVPVAVVHLGFHPSVLPEDQLRGFGLLVPTEERRNVLGVIFSSSSFPHRAAPGHTLLTCMVGGAPRPELVEASDDALLSAVRAELESLLKLPAELGAELTVIVRWPSAIPQYELGYLANEERLRSALRRWPELHLLGNAWGGVGVNDCVRTARALARALTQPS